MDNILKVSSKSNPNSIAGMIAALTNEGSTKIMMMCIGAGSVNQGVKAVIIANGFMAPSGRSLIIKPAFETIKTDFQNEFRTGIKLTVEVQNA